LWGAASFGMLQVVSSIHRNKCKCCWKVEFFSEKLQQSHVYQRIIKPFHNTFLTSVQIRPGHYLIQNIFMSPHIVFH
jgi:hypothetical protein